jgi:hypothetical protein
MGKKKTETAKESPKEIPWVFKTAWVIHDEWEGDFIRDIYEQSDRAAAIMLRLSWKWNSGLVGLVYLLED